MRTEVIVCQRCCFCLPLRYGLIVWGYVRLVFAGILLLSMSYTLDRFIHSSRSSRTSNVVIASLIIILLIADIILGIIFIIGCHTKNVALIKRYYHHNLFLLTLMILFCLFVFGFMLYLIIKLGIPYATFVIYILSDIIGACTYVVIQIYVVLLVRSQFIKLKTGCQFRFENKVTEPECSLNIETVKSEKTIEHNNTKELDDFDEIRNYV